MKQHIPGPAWTLGLVPAPPLSGHTVSRQSLHLSEPQKHLSFPSLSHGGEGWSSPGAGPQALRGGPGGALRFPGGKWPQDGEEADPAHTPSLKPGRNIFRCPRPIKRFTSSCQDQCHTFAAELSGILSLQPSDRSSLRGPRSPCHSTDEIGMAGNSFSSKLVSTCVQRGENHRNSAGCL